MEVRRVGVPSQVSSLGLGSELPVLFTNVRCQMLVRGLTKTLRLLDCKLGLLRDGAIRTLFHDGSYNNN
ncbi:hypothetical protein TNCV_1233201 [Trichonephila clavipes]|nr:hypothetical protein TNCV_1233201 [Trichonephila clavipes]